MIQAASKPVLSVHNLSKSYGNVSALSGITLDVRRGEVLAVVGNNGAGKSSLVKILAGVTDPDSGTIAVDDRPVRIDSPATARALGIATVFQNLSLCDNLTIAENIYLGQEIGRYRLDWATMEHHAAQVLRQLSPTAFRVTAKVSELSSGQRQTVAIARSLLGDPSIIVLDEPTAMFGADQQALVLHLIRQLRIRGLGVLLLSPTLDEVGVVADRIVVLRQGQVNGVFDAYAGKDQIRAAMSVSPNPETGNRTPAGAYLFSAGIS